MGSRGTIPKRSGTRLGHVTKAEEAGEGKSKSPAGLEISWYEPDPAWHPMALQWYESLQVSGQKFYYEQSDVSTAYFIADQMSYYLFGSAKGRSAILLTAVLSGMSTLLATEGDRRRASIELQRETGDIDPPSKAMLEDYQKSLNAPRPKAAAS